MNRDLLFIAGVIATIAVIFIPLPTVMMDLLLVFSIAVSLLTLLAAITVKEPVKFSVFPSVLLLSTAYRLALNIATTRLILTNAKTDGTLAAGRVVRSFGEFVAGNEPIVGFVIFLIIIVVNFVVITKGATRISEVAARFALDGMPGKQMAIDADLNAGLITADDARRRRQDVSHEAGFYGAMDGATKFVRGDAIAGLLITAINIVGGLILGVAKYDMPVSKALSTFTILSIGDGLVAGMPALMVSIAAGLMVTRSASTSTLGSDVIGQLFLGERKSLYIAGGVLGMLALTALVGSGMPFLPLVGVGAALVTIGVIAKRGAEQAKRTEAAKELQRPPEKLESLLHVESLEILLGVRLLRIGPAIMERVAALRRQLALDLGIVVPPVVIREGDRLDPNHYVVKLRGVAAARGSVRPGEWLAVNGTTALEGTATTDPVFSRPAYWIGEGAIGRARELGYTTTEAPQVIAAHFGEVVRDRAAEILSRDDVAALLKSLKEKRPAVVEEIAGLVKPGELQKVLQNLLREGVSIRDLGTILEAVGDTATRTKDTEVLTEYVRSALGRQICQKLLESDGRLYVVTLDPRLEELVKGGMVRTDGGSTIALSPEVITQVGERLNREFDRLVLAGHAPVVLCSAPVRAAVKRLIDALRQGTAVLSYNEVVREVQIVTGGVIEG